MPIAVKTSWYYILLALAAGDSHGLGIARDVQELSDGQIRLWPAALYGALQELSALGWIEERRQPGESEKRRYYRLTRSGRTVLAGETTRLAGVVRIARARTRPRPGETS